MSQEVTFVTIWCRVCNSWLMRTKPSSCVAHDSIVLGRYFNNATSKYDSYQLPIDSDRYASRHLIISTNNKTMSTSSANIFFQHLTKYVDICISTCNLDSTIVCPSSSWSLESIFSEYIWLHVSELFYLFRMQYAVKKSKTNWQHWINITNKVPKCRIGINKDDFLIFSLMCIVATPTSTSCTTHPPVTCYVKKRMVIRNNQFY